MAFSNNDKNNLKFIAEKFEARRFGPKLPTKDKNVQQADPTLLDIVGGIAGLFYGIKINDGESARKLLSTPPSRTPMGQTFLMLSDILKDLGKSKKFLTDTLLDESKSKEYWQHNIKEGIISAIQEISSKKQEFGRIILEADPDFAILASKGKMNIFEVLKIIDSIDDRTIKHKIDSLSEIEISKETIDKVSNISKMINVFVKEFPNEFKGKVSNISNVLTAYWQMLEPFKKGGRIGKAIDELSLITNSDFKTLDAIIDYIDVMEELKVKIIAIGQSEGLIDAGLEIMEKTFETLSYIVGKVSNAKIDPKKIEAFNKSVDIILKIVLISSAVLILGSIAMTLVKPQNLALFTITLFAFTAGIIWVYTTFSKDIKNSLGFANDLAKLVIISSLVLILGALIVTPQMVIQSLAFVFTLGIFIGGLLGIYHLFAKGISGALDIGKDLGKLVFLSGMTLIIGSLFMKVIDIKSLLFFAGTLSLFVVTLIGGTFLAIRIAGAFGGFKGNTNEILKGFAGSMVSFGLLVMLCGVTLILASKYANFIDLKGLTLFTLILTGFIIAMSIPFRLYHTQSDEILEGAFSFGALIVVTTGILMLGGWLFTKYPELIPGILIYSIVVGGFIFGVSLAFLLFDAEKIWPKVIAFTLLVAITGGLLLFAGNLIAKNPWMILGIFGFIAATLLLVGGLSAILKSLDKANIGARAIISMLVVAGVVLIISFAFEKIAEVVNMLGGWNGVSQFAVVCGILFGIIGALSLLTLGIGALLGNGAVTIMALAAVGVLIAVAGAIWIVCDAFANIADTLDKLQKIEKIDSTTLMGNLDVIVKLAEALGPLAKMAPDILSISLSVTAMGVMMDKIAESVQNYASLTVPIYNGKKVVGYRQLRNADFRQASTNIKLIITTLGETIIKTYDKKPEIFESPLIGKSKFAMVTSSLQTLAPLLSNIAYSVKNYASLTIPIYEGTKIVGYDHLSKKDFNDAAENVKLVIETLGKAIIQAYEAHPDYYEGGSGGWFSNGSKFAQTVSSNITLATLLSSISNAVRDYANMVYFTEYKYDKETNKIIPTGKSQKLEPKHFQEAANNVVTILSTLGNAIVTAYDMNPEIYEGGNGGWFGTGSKFAQTVSSNLTLATLLSNISSAVKDYANMTVFEQYVYDKEAKKLIPQGDQRKLEPKDFVNASNNVITVISTLGGAIMKAYEEHPDWYEGGDGSWFSNGSIFSQVVKSNMTLGTLLSSIAKAVADYANLQIATEYIVTPEGKIIPKNVRPIENKDFTAAAENINTILSVLGDAITQHYNDNKNLYNEKSGGFLGFGGQSKYAMVIETNMKLAELISGIAKGVKDYASLTITEYGIVNDKLTPVSIRPMNQDDFDNAAKHIQTIITTLGKAIIDTYNDPKYQDWFDDGEDSDFAMACAAIGSMGSMISNISKGIQDYANMRIPDYSQPFDENGNPTAYVNLDDTYITKAKDTIQTVLTTLGESIIDYYKKNPDYFDDGPESIFNTVVDAAAKMGDIISSVAQGLSAYASLQIPIKWDSSGTPIEFKQMTNTEIEKAGQTIGTIISVIGTTIYGLYSGKKATIDNAGNVTLTPMSPDMQKMAQEMFQTSEDDPNGVFYRIIDACVNMGSMIQSIAEGVQMYASQEMPIWSNGKITGHVHLGDTEYKNAASSIASVITTIGTALLNTYADPKYKELFQPIKSNVSFGILGGEVKYSEETTFDKIISATAKLGMAISGIAEGVAKFAGGYYVDPITKENKQLKEQDFTDAGDFVARTVTSFITAIKKPEVLKLFEDVINTDFDVHIGTIFNSGAGVKTTRSNSPIIKVIDATAKIGQVISSVASAVIKLSTATVPYKGKDGKIHYKHLGQTEFTKAGNTISTVITTIMDAISEQADKKAFKEGNKTIQTVVSVVSGAAKAVHDIAQTVVMYSNLKFPNPYKADGEPIILSEKDFITAGENMASLIINIFKGINNIQNDPTVKKLLLLGNTLYGIQKFSGKSNTHPLVKSINTIAEITASFTTFVSTLFGQVKSISEIYNEIKGYKVIGEEKENLTSTINNIIDIFVSTNTSISKLSNLTPISLGWGNNFQDGISIVKNNIGEYIEVLNRIIELGKEAENIDQEKFKNIGDISEYISDKLNNIKTNTLFNQHTQSLEKYVKAINSVQIYKVDRLNKFVNGMNELANKLGNLDGLTDAIAKNLATELQKLTEQLSLAASIINKADEIQENRYKKMTAESKNIKELLSQKLTIEINNITEGSQPGQTPTDNPGVTSSPDTTDQTSGAGMPGGNGGAKNTNTPKGNNSSTQSSKSTVNDGQPSRNNDLTKIQKFPVVDKNGVPTGNMFVNIPNQK